MQTMLVGQNQNLIMFLELMDRVVVLDNVLIREDLNGRVGRNSGGLVRFMAVFRLENEMMESEYDGLATV